MLDAARERAKANLAGVPSFDMYEGGSAKGNVQTILHTVLDMLDKKGADDVRREKAGQDHITLPAFAIRHFVSTFGVKSLALKKLANLSASVRELKETSKTLRTCGRITGMICDGEQGFDVYIGPRLSLIFIMSLLSHLLTPATQFFGPLTGEEDFDSLASDVLLLAIRVSFPGQSIKVNMNDSNMVSLEAMEAGTLAVMTSKFYFADHDDLDRRKAGSVDLSKGIKQELQGLLTGSTCGKARVADWLEWLLNESHESRDNAKKFFEQLYTQHDQNGDNCLDLKEFTSVIQVVKPLADEDEILQMYEQALELTGDGDNMCQEAFMKVCMQHHLPVLRATDG
jgi:hypothetical protein